MNHRGMFGFQDYTSEEIRLSGASRVVDAFFGDGGRISRGRRSLQPVPPTRLASVKPPDLVFIAVDATPVEDGHPYAASPIAVKLAATVTNRSDGAIPIGVLPQPLCTETREAFYCTSSSDYIEPGESADVWYEIVARDMFSRWMLLQIVDRTWVDPPSFSGLEGVSAVLEAALGRAFESRAALIDRFLERRGSTRDRAEWSDLVDRYRWITPSGECYHTDRACRPSLSSSRIRLVDAYRMGYHPCSKCSDIDWWREGQDTYAHGDDVFWLLSFGGDRLAAWVVPDMGSKELETGVIWTEIPSCRECSDF